MAHAREGAALRVAVSNVGVYCLYVTPFVWECDEIWSVTAKRCPEPQHILIKRVAVDGVHEFKCSKHREGRVKITSEVILFVVVVTSLYS